MRIWPLLAAGASAASLSSIGLAVCGCAQCRVQSFAMDAPQAVVDYGNGSAGVYDWLGAARDFLPAPVTLTSSADLNCSLALALLLNGSDVLAQFPWTQVTNGSCSANVTGGQGGGDYAFVAALRSPTAEVVFSQPLAAPPAVAGISFGFGAASLVLGALPDCALPASFSYCGSNFTQTSCAPGAAAYSGTCVAPMGAPPLWCHGLPLFPAPAQVEPCGTACKVAVSASAVVGAVAAVTVAAAASTVSIGAQAFSAAAAAAAPVFIPQATLAMPIPMSGMQRRRRKHNL